jgi:hypothetical protein
MSNVVQFLETLARNPNPLSTEDLSAAISSAGLEPAARKAILDADADALNRAVGGRATMLCFVAPAENDEPKDNEEQESEDEAPDREASSRAA